MTLRGAAVVPSAPLLVPALAGGSAVVDAELRAMTRAAVAALVEAAGRSSGDVVVVGSALRTGTVEGTWDWSGFGVDVRGGPESALPLPLALAVGAWLLDDVDAGRDRTYLGVAEAAPTKECAALGTELVAGPRDVYLLVVGDGSARRSEKAPGHLDPAAATFDARVEAALASADAQALLALGADEAIRLLADGRAAWHVLAGACAGSRLQGRLLHAAAPYGVGYFVASWTPRLELQSG